MKKLVTALIIILPLILIIALFAVTGIARISADIPATGITIANKGADGVLFFDLADYRYPFSETELGIEVLPRVAKNRKYDLKITDLNGKETDLVKREDNGAFTLNGIGLTKLTYTSKDGGYSDSVLFNVTASAPVSLVPTITDASGNFCALEEDTVYDYKVTLNSGKYTLGATCDPASVLYTYAKYSSANEQILYFSDTNGHFNARFGGDTVITMRADGANGPIQKTIAVSVKSSAPTTIEGMDIKSNARLNVPIGVKALTFGVQSELNLSTEEIKVKGDNIHEFSAVKVDGIEGAFNVNVKFTDVVKDEFSKNYQLSLGEEKFEFSIDFKNRDFNVYAPANARGEDDIVVLTGTTTKLVISSNPHSSNIKYSWSVGEQAAIKIISSKGNECTINADAAFDTMLYVDWEELDENGDIVASGRTERVLKSVNGYSALIFAENSETYGLGGLAIASDKYDENGKLVPYSHESKFRPFDKNANVGPISDIEFSVSDQSLASVTFDGTNLFVNALESGDVTVTATWKYGAMFGIAPATFTFRAVKGVAVDSDKDIRLAYKSSLPVVLVGDIYLGENLFDKSEMGGKIPKYDEDTMREKLLEYTSELPTTADWTYYENMGMPHPTVRYCLDITADLHGNGHFISAQYITDMLDSTDTLYDFAVFRGPLDFVATNTTGIKLASVKGQDNIVFLVRKDGISIDNAVLKGCDDETLYDNEQINLSLLNNVGTTLEIMSDASVTNSRIMNGRTVVRIFGRDGIDKDSAVNAQREKINVTIEGCVLQSAREFILKIGTNRAIVGDVGNPSPSLLDKDGNEYGGFNSPACDEYVNDDYFMSNYILTDVTLKDSILRTSGMLSIGIESHFAGEMLAGNPNSIFKIDGWHDLAATSYPSILRMTGDVKILDWKDVSSVDSSTLIEADTTQELLAFLALNISEMLKAVQEYGGDKYADIMTSEKGQQFVHGGIAFYGGGKNYSILDMSGYTGKNMKQYNINLDILKNSPDFVISNQGYFLPLAAGVYDFRFIMEYKNA